MMVKQKGRVLCILPFLRHGQMFLAAYLVRFKELFEHYIQLKAICPTFLQLCQRILKDYPTSAT